MQKKQIVFLIILLFAVGISVSAQWSLTGNSGTNPPANFLGTKDLKPLVFKTNKVGRMQIKTHGGLIISDPKDEL